MTGARRRAAVLLGAGAIAVGGAIGVAPGARAGVLPDGWSVDDWASSVDGGTVGLSGTMTAPASQTILSITLALTRTGESEYVGCEDRIERTQTTGYADNDFLEDEEPPEQPEEGTDVFAFSRSITPSCNGTYTASVVGTADGPVDAGDSPEDDDISSDEHAYVDEGEPVELTVAAPAPDPSFIGAGYAPTTRVVTVVWLAPEGYGPAPEGCTATTPGAPPDFLGYQVQRSIDGAPFETMASPGPGTVCYSETTTVDGTYKYRVLTRRDNGTGGSITSSGVTSRDLSVAPASPIPSTTVPTETTRAQGPTGTTRPAGGATAATAPSTTVDEAFSPTLDYGDLEPGEDAAQLPDDADSFLDFVPSPGEGILVPFAIAECLAVWALHLRYLAGRADALD